MSRVRWAIGELSHGYLHLLEADHADARGTRAFRRLAYGRITRGLEELAAAVDDDAEEGDA
jgi:ssRNA-specific RNase YbeY (16S rRNA maturation enzyme)